MKTLAVLGKYMDQPLLIKKFKDAVPAVLVLGSCVYSFNHVAKLPEKEKRKAFIKDSAVLTGTVGSALLATRGIHAIKIGQKTLFNGLKGLTESTDVGALVEKNTKLVDDFVQNNKVSNKAKEILSRAKGAILSFRDIKTVESEFEDNKKGKNLLDELIPNPENIDSKHIFSEIKRLSIMGLVPVLGGIAGGIIGDKVTEKNWKERIPNKVKEGSYQYLANIFLCNVGAGAALWAMEKAKITSKTSRAIGMVAGITAVGILGGSAIANFIGKTCIDPFFKNSHGHHCHGKRHHSHLKVYNERTPEMLDVGLHVDDVSTVAVLSGLKWIEPALPIMYSISGYRAGIGYRNGDNCNQ